MAVAAALIYLSITGSCSSTKEGKRREYRQGRWGTHRCCTTTHLTDYAHVGFLFLPCGVGCGLTCLHAVQLAEALASNSTLEVLELPGGPWSLTRTAALFPRVCAFLHVICSGAPVSRVLFADNQIEESGAKALVQVGCWVATGLEKYSQSPLSLLEEASTQRASKMQ